MTENTTMKVRKTTLDRVKDARPDGVGSYDSFVNELLDVYEEEHGDV